MHYPGPQSIRTNVTATKTVEPQFVQLHTVKAEKEEEQPKKTSFFGKMMQNANKISSSKQIAKLKEQEYLRKIRRLYIRAERIFGLVPIQFPEHGNQITIAFELFHPAIKFVYVVPERADYILPFRKEQVFERPEYVRLPLLAFKNKQDHTLNVSPLKSFSIL